MIRVSVAIGNQHPLSHPYGMATGTRNPMGFCSIRVWAYTKFYIREFLNGINFVPVGFASVGLFSKYPNPQTCGYNKPDNI